MPEISRFFGIVIQMYADDHHPPHFHARYAGRAARIAIETHQVLAGSLPPKALALVIEWAAMHGDELRALGARSGSASTVEDRAAPLASTGHVARPFCRAAQRP